MILERPESNKKLYLHDHTSIAKYIVQYTTRMFLNMSEYVRWFSICFESLFG